jgi:hypothetical protein
MDSLGVAEAAGNLGLDGDMTHTVGFELIQ